MASTSLNQTENFIGVLKCQSEKTNEVIECIIVWRNTPAKVIRRPNSLASKVHRVCRSWFSFMSLTKMKHLPCKSTSSLAAVN